MAKNTITTMLVFSSRWVDCHQAMKAFIGRLASGEADADFEKMLKAQPANIGNFLDNLRDGERIAGELAAGLREVRTAMHAKVSEATRAAMTAGCGVNIES